MYVYVRIFFVVHKLASFSYTFDDIQWVCILHYPILVSTICVAKSDSCQWYLILPSYISWSSCLSDICLVAFCIFEFDIFDVSYLSVSSVVLSKLYIMFLFCIPFPFFFVFLKMFNIRAKVVACARECGPFFLLFMCISTVAFSFYLRIISL